MLAIRNLEVHLAHGCNLACESCSHYSNQGHKGTLTLDQARDWFGAWSGRLAPVEFSLLGGEPAINPDLAAMVTLVREHWPDAKIRIVTNGFLLPRHPDLPKRMAEAGNAYLMVSIHHPSEVYRARLAPALRLLDEWIATHGIEVGLYNSQGYWTRRYKGFGKGMMPYDDRRSRASWELCPAKYCPQIHDGKIWKCAALAYLGMQDRKYVLSDAWKPYLAYEPLSPDCGDAELHEFFARKDEAQCAMCPAAPERFALPLPYPTSSLAAGELVR